MSNLNLNPTFARSDAEPRMEIDATRPRQTERPAAPFRSVLAGGVSLLMTGAEVATHVVGGPVLAAAVHDARVNSAGAIAGAAMAGLGAGASHPAATAAAAAGGDGSPQPGGMGTPVAQGQAANLQMLAFQQQMQQ